MKKLLACLAVALVLAGGYVVRIASAGITCTLPFQLQNNTTADATQVMANYNALVTCFTNAAAAGVNSDITALTALVTPLTPAQGGSAEYYGGTSAGTASAHTVTIVTPSGYTLAAGKQVTFIVGITNTGAATLNVNSTGPLALQRPTQAGAAALVGGELTAGQVATVLYDGTQYQIKTAAIQVGEVRFYGGTSATAPVGWAFADGTCISQTTYATLFSLVSTTYGSCGAGLFALPDGRGRLLAGSDNQGGGGAASRITVGTSGCAGNTLGTGCGTQALAITQPQLPNVTFAITANVNTAIDTKVVGATLTAGPTAIAVTAASSTGTDGTIATLNSGTVSGTAASGGSGTAYVPLNPLLIVKSIVKL